MTDTSSKLPPQFTFADILNQEDAAIRLKNAPSGREPWKCPSDKTQKKAYQEHLSETYKKLNDANRTALCLSGGGIRSAAICLGVLQRLASIDVTPRKSDGKPEKPLLCEFDYLSTVSGGGYIGSWLSAWLFRRRTSKRTGPSDPTVVYQLGRRGPDGSEPEPIEQLRKNALFIARRPGAFSIDIWDDIGTVARNLLLNWGVMLPAAALIVLVAQIFAVEFVRCSGYSPLVNVVAGLSGIILMMSSLGYSAVHLPTRHLMKAVPLRFVEFDLVFWLLGSLLLCFTINGVIQWHLNLQFDDIGIFIPLVCTFGWAALYAMTWAAGGIVKPHSPAGEAHGGKSEAAETQSAPHANPRAQWRACWSWTFAGAIFGALLGLGVLGASWLLVGPAKSMTTLIIFVAGTPYLIAARLISGGVFSAASNEAVDSDVNLEWLARSAAYFLLWGTMLTLSAATIVFGHYAAHYVGHHLNIDALQGKAGYATLASGTTLSGLVAALIGLYSAQGPIPKITVAARKYLTINQLAAVAAGGFALGFALTVSSVFDKFLFKSGFLTGQLDWPLTAAFITSVLLFCAAALFSRIVNINRFSLHGFYRNRLVRSFLGTSRAIADRNKSRDTFSDYDGSDNPYIRQLWPGNDVEVPKNQCQNLVADDWLPFHIVNVTANLTATKNLGWQERKAASFTISPLHAGSAALGHGLGAYLPTTYQDGTRTYGGELGISLGTAMAISGAALDSNMGYYSSPGISLLMTLFNVRLGWWLSNPAKANESCNLPGPGWSLGPLVQEAFGGINEESNWMLLSDGGHFDNTGLYEMIRRQCRTIVLVDGGCDAGYAFSDLGRTLMKIEVDLGIRIEFTGLDQLKARFAERPLSAKSSPYWAVGRIYYRTNDSNRENGLLLYLKASLHGTEPIGILSYGLTHPAFPQDSTLNQFYEESEFEAYRSLGFEIADQALIKASVRTAASTPGGNVHVKTLDEIILALESGLK